MERLNAHELGRRGRRDRYLETKLEAGGLCSFGNTGGPGSDSSQHTSSNTTNTDKRLVVDTGSVGVSSDSSNVNVTATDHDTVARSFDLARTSSEQTLNTVSKALGFASDAAGANLVAIQEAEAGALGFAGKSLDFASKSLAAVQASGAGLSDAYKSAAQLSSGQAYLVAGVVGAVVIVAVIALKRKAG
jgi:hypothetical protein